MNLKVIQEDRGVVKLCVCGLLMNVRVLKGDRYFNECSIFFDVRFLTFDF